MKKYYTLGTAIIRNIPSFSGTKLLSVPEKYILEETGEINGDWIEVFYNKGKMGWIKFMLVEEYVPESEFCVEISEELKTDTVNDGEQYIKWEGRTTPLFNLCGEFCCAYIVGDSIKNLLFNVKSNLTNVYALYVLNDKPTGTSILKSILKLYDFEGMSLQNLLRDLFSNALSLSPARLEKLLVNNFIIVGVTIDRQGNLNTNGTINHWVVLDSVIPFRAGEGLVKVYNPFTNMLETYSYREFMNSARKFGGILGLIVPKKIV